MVNSIRHSRSLHQAPLLPPTWTPIPRTDQEHLGFPQSSCDILYHIINVWISINGGIQVFCRLSLSSIIQSSHNLEYSHRVSFTADTKWSCSLVKCSTVKLNTFWSSEIVFIISNGHSLSSVTHAQYRIWKGWNLVFQFYTPLHWSHKQFTCNFKCAIMHQMLLNQVCRWSFANTNNSANNNKKKHSTSNTDIVT